MLAYIVDAAWDAGCYKVKLMSGRAQESVHALYRKCGFDAELKQAYLKRAR